MRTSLISDASESMSDEEVSALFRVMRAHRHIVEELMGRDGDNDGGNRLMAARPTTPTELLRSFVLTSGMSRWQDENPSFLDEVGKIPVEEHEGLMTAVPWILHECMDYSP